MLDQDRYERTDEQLQQAERDVRFVDRLLGHRGDPAVVDRQTHCPIDVEEVLRTIEGRESAREGDVFTKAFTPKTLLRGARL